jgi:chromosome partitioning protein
MHSKWEMTNMRRVIFNQKGGVGKSTIVCNLAAIGAAEGKRTLVVDLDPQCNTTQYLLGSTVKELETTLLDYFESLLYFSFRPKGPELCIHETPFPKLDLMPAHPELEDLKDKLESRYKTHKLKEALESFSGYEFIYMDTPPAFNFYSRSALIASEGCLIPFDCDDFSRRALYILLHNVRKLQLGHNPHLKVEGIVVNQFQARANHPQEMVAELIEEGLPVLDTYLSSSIKIRESRKKALPMVHLDPHHKLTREFQALYQKLNR